MAESTLALYEIDCFHLKWIGTVSGKFKNNQSSDTEKLRK